MDFWKTDDSSAWQEESWSQNLHESLFKSDESRKPAKQQKTKKNKKPGSQILLTKDGKKQAVNEEEICEEQEEEAVPRKRKKKGKVKHTNRGSDDVCNAELSAKQEKPGCKDSSVSSETEEISSNDLTMPDVGNGDTASTGISNEAIVQSDIKTKKKRKRKAKNNKFKEEAMAKEDERDTNCFDDVQSPNTEENGSSLESPEQILSGKERRKLRRKMAKEQLRTKQNQAKVIDQKTSDDSNGDHPSKSPPQSSRDAIKLSGKEDKGEIPDTSSHGDTSSNLILANTRRKTQMKPDISLKTQMESQLKSSQFRFLNEQLYKVTGDKAKEMFASDGSAFLTYHEGFTQQVQQWPANPVDICIEALKKRPASLVVGDFGCGDAKIARSVKQKVHSFDLYSINKHVTVCDTKKVPLKDGVLDVAVFCLSLMGTNWMDYVKEANRVLKTGGLLKVAEVASRFTSPASFLSVMKSLGFQLKTKDVSNKMFYLFDFKKKQAVTTVPTVKGPILKPCLYKKR